MGLPGDDVEHAADGDAGQSAVEATQAKVDGVKWRGDAECWGEESVGLTGLICLPETHPVLKPKSDTLIGRYVPTELICLPETHHILKPKSDTLIGRYVPTGLTCLPDIHPILKPKSDTRIGRYA